MRPATVLRLALAGTRADAMRVVLTAVSAALATVTMLAAATVLAVKGGAPDYDDTVVPLHYTNALIREPGLRPGVALVLLMLTIPVLGLAAQCTRLGAPERNRRLAALRLAGATPRQAVLVAVAETGVAAGLGAVAGLGGYFAGRVVAHRPQPGTGRLPLPTDVLPPWWVFVALCAAVPLLATALAVVTLRRVTFGPFGVVRRVRANAPRPWPAILILVGLGVYPVLGLVLRQNRWRVPDGLILAVFVLGAAAALAGLVLGTGWLTAFTGRVLRRVARRPVGVLAGERLSADPWSTARAYTGLLLVVAFGAGTAAVAAVFRAELRPETPHAAPDPFYGRAFDLLYYAIVAGTLLAAAALLVSVAESIVTRRRSYAALVATGVPRAVLARTALWQTLAPLAVAVPATLAVGTALPLLVYRPAGSGLPVAPPWAELAAIGGGALLMATVVTGLGLLVLGPSTRPAELRTS